eukprot:2802595-Pleurochrysis_carterae.AAC.1
MAGWVGSLLGGPAVRTKEKSGLAGRRAGNKAGGQTSLVRRRQLRLAVCASVSQAFGSSPLVHQHRVHPPCHSSALADPPRSLFSRPSGMCVPREWERACQTLVRKHARACVH